MQVSRLTEAGGPTAAVIALHNPNIQVSVLDRDGHRIGRWNSAHLPIQEPELDKVVRAVRDGAILVDCGRSLQRSPNLVFTTDSKESLSKADMIFLAVNTPTKAFGCGAGKATNMDALDGATRDIAQYAKDGVIVVEKSTVPCGTARRISSSVSVCSPPVCLHLPSQLCSINPEMVFEVLSNPEFLSEGKAIEDLLQPDRIIIGSSQTTSGKAAASALAGLYTTWVAKSKILQVNSCSSELSKLVANAMLAQRISSINSISAICEATGADITEVARSIGSDPRIGSKFLEAGLGYGGSCFKKDIASLIYLAESLGLEEVAEYWHQVNTINEMQRKRFATSVIRQLDENLIGRKIALLGFSFKKATGDTRESLAVDVINQLLLERPTEIAIFDPYCSRGDIRRELRAKIPEYAKAASAEVKVYEEVYAACDKADAILIITDCDQFKCEMPTQSTRSEVEASIQCYADELTLPRGSTYQLLPRPQCSEGCMGCESMKGPAQDSARHQVDWRRVAAGMKQPWWVFDGRCVLDVDIMKELGFEIRSIGRRN